MFVRLNFTRARYQNAFTAKVPYSLFLAGKKTLGIKFSQLKLVTCFPLQRDLFILFVDRYGQKSNFLVGRDVKSIKCRKIRHG